MYKVKALKMFQSVELGDSKVRKSNLTYIDPTTSVGADLVKIEMHEHGYILKCGDDIKLVGFNNVCYASLVADEPAKQKK